MKHLTGQYFLHILKVLHLLCIDFPLWILLYWMDFTHHY